MASLARGNPARWWTSRSCGVASRAPNSLFISPFRRWITTLLLTFLLLLLGSVWYISNPARISRLSEVLLSRVIGGRVTVQSGRLSLSGTLILSGIDVRTAEGDTSPAAELPVFSAEQIEARFDWFSLLSGQLSATQLVATAPVFRPIEDLGTGHWNFERLRPGFGATTQKAPGPGNGLDLPVVVVHDGRVRRAEIRNGAIQEIYQTVVDGQLTPDAQLPTTYHIQFSQKSVKAPASPAQDDALALRGTWDSATNAFTVSADNVVMGDTLRSDMPAQVREWCEQHQLAGRLSQFSLISTRRDGLSVTTAFDGVSLLQMIEPQQGIAVGDDRPAYPLDIRDVRGKITFALGTPAMHIIDLSGEVLGYRFSIDDCLVHGDSFNSPFELKNLRFTNALVGDQYPPLFMAFTASQDILQRIAPHGRFDIAIDISRATPFGQPQYSGTIDAHDARMRFAHFPYPLDHLNGRISFDDQSVTFRNVTARGDLSDVTIDGSAGTKWSNHFIDLTISSNNAFFDDRLAAALPTQNKELWDLFSISAHGSFTCRVIRSGAIQGEPKFVIDADLDSGTGYVRTLPYPLADARGHLHFETDETRIEHLTGRTGADGSGRVEINGIVHHARARDAISRLEPEIQVNANVPIDDTLLHALPEQWTAKLADISLAGRINYAGTVKRSTAAELSIQAAGTLTWSDGRLQMPVAGQQLSLSGIAATGVISPQSIDLRNFAATLALGDKPQPVKITLAGTLDNPAMSGIIAATINGEDLALPDSPPTFFPKNLADNWLAFAPAGKIDLAAKASLRINLPADPKAPDPALRLSDNLSLASYTATLNLHELALKNSAWPDPLTRINGTLDLAPNKIAMSNMTANFGDILLIWKGLLKPDTGWISLSGQADAKAIPEKFLQYLPDTVSKNLDFRQEGSSFTLYFDSLSRPQADKPWVFEGKLTSDKLAIKGPMPMTIDSVIAAGKGTWDPATAAAFDFAGTLKAANLSVSDHTLDTLQASLNIVGADHRIALSDLQAKVAGGTLQGEIIIRTASQPIPTTTIADTQAQPLHGLGGARPPETMPSDGGGGGYTANLVLHNAELPLLLLSSKATDDERHKVGTGKVSASLSLQQTFGPNADRTGRGDLEVTDANIYDVPLSMGLMQIITLRLPLAHSFQHASMSYFLRNNDITFERILLESPGVNLAGAGTVAISDRALNLNFITQSPNLTIPILSAFQSELLQVNVTGTAASPKVTPVPLSPIANMLKSLLPQAHADPR